MLSVIRVTVTVRTLPYRRLPVHLQAWRRPCAVAGGNGASVAWDAAVPEQSCTRLFMILCHGPAVV